MRVNGETISVEMLAEILGKSRYYVRKRWPCLDPKWSVPVDHRSVLHLVLPRLAFTPADAHMLYIELGLAEPLARSLTVTTQERPIPIPDASGDSLWMRKRERRRIMAYFHGVDDMRMDTAHEGTQ